MSQILITDIATQKKKVQKKMAVTYQAFIRNGMARFE